MANSKYIIHKEGVEVLHELFHPFINNGVNQRPEITAISEEISHQRLELEQEIQKLKQELEFLSSTKENLKTEIKDWEEKKNQIRQEEEKIRSQTQTEAQKIIEDSKKQAETILAEAQKQKETIEAETSNNKQQFITEARKLGYREGFAKGYQKGEQERDALEAYLKKILNEAIRKKDQIVESVRQHLIDLVYTAVHKVVKKITAEDKKVVLKNITDALRKIDDPAKLIIKVSYDDLKASTMFKSQLMNSLKGLQQVEVVADPNIEPGGCIVETEFTIIDSRISTQLDKIGMALSSLDVTKTQSH